MFSENIYRPLHLKCCDQNLFVAAVSWALSDGGGNVWRDTRTNMAVIDPQGLVRFETLFQVLRERRKGWEREDVLTGPPSEQRRASGIWLIRFLFKLDH